MNQRVESWLEAVEIRSHMHGRTYSYCELWRLRRVYQYELKSILNYHTGSVTFRVLQGIPQQNYML